LSTVRDVLVATAAF